MAFIALAFRFDASSTLLFSFGRDGEIAKTDYRRNGFECWGGSGGALKL